MRKILLQIFLFLIPTLIVALLFIPLLQQNVFLAGEGDLDMGLVKVDLQVIAFDTVSNNAMPTLLVIGSVLVAGFILNESVKISIIKNHSPPAIISV